MKEITSGLSLLDTISRRFTVVNDGFDGWCDGDDVTVLGDHGDDVTDLKVMIWCWRCDGFDGDESERLRVRAERMRVRNSWVMKKKKGWGMTTMPLSLIGGGKHD